MTRTFQKLAHYYSALGARGVIMFLYAKLSGTTPLFRKKLPGLKHPIWVRVGTTDASVLKQVLIEKQYDVPLIPEPKFIVDAGANIGLASVFFANKYPNAIIMAIEPERENFELLKKNAASYPNIRPLNAALWYEDRNLILIDPGAGSHGFQIQASRASESRESVGIKSLTVVDLMAAARVDTIDLLKIDIEGAEKEVFQHSQKWIDQVKVIMAELHDPIQDGCSTAFAVATQHFKNRTSLGETVICSR